MRTLYPNFEKKSIAYLTACFLFYFGTNCEIYQADMCFSVYNNYLIFKYIPFCK